MKRYFAMVLAVVLLCICTGAVAMGQGRTDNLPPTYTATVTKLERVATTGGADQKGKNATYYGSGAGCGGGYSNGDGYQGIVYMRIPEEQAA